MANKIRVLSVVVGVALTGSAALAGPLGASTPPIDGAGSVVCSVKASLTFVPPLTVGGATPTTITLKSSLSACSGTGNGANVKSGKSVDVGTASTNDCVTLLEAPPAPQTGSVKWSVLPHTPKLSNSTVQLTGSGADAGPPITTDSAGSVLSGSFNGDDAATHSVIKQTFAQLEAACLGAKGLKTITIIPPGSTFTLSSPS